VESGGDLSNRSGNYFIGLLEDTDCTREASAISAGRKDELEVFPFFD
jgi:hypothetical protein